MILRAILSLALLFSAAPQAPAPSDIRAIAGRAYTFAYPMVLMEFTRRAAVERGNGVMNRFVHSPAFPDASFHQVIRPNADTLYSTGWLDLSAEPIMLHVPDTHDRYYLMQFMDAWTDTFDCPGKRTMGTKEQWFAITGPGWKGTVPDGAKQIKSPTNSVWLLGRTQTNGASDYPTVRGLQRGYTLVPMSQYPNGVSAAGIPAPQSVQAQRAAGAAPVTPPKQVERLSAREFFDTFAQLLAANPPHPGDEAMMKDLARIGIEPGKSFHADAMGAGAAQAIDEGAHAAAERLSAMDGRAGSANRDGWSGFSLKVGRYGNDYEARAAVARIGLGALPPEDAIYMHSHQDAQGQEFDGAHKYRIHFDRGLTPPVRAFWSLTMYSPDGYFVLNPINRFAIGDRDKLEMNADGSLDIYIQHDAPGGSKDANWLPAPAGAFNLSLRMYWPKEEVTNRKWTPPGIHRFTD